MAIVSRKVTRPDASTAGKVKAKLIKPSAVPQGRKLVGTMVNRWGDIFCYQFIEKPPYAPRQLINGRVTIKGEDFKVTPKKEEIPEKTRTPSKKESTKSAPKKKEPKTALAKKRSLSRSSRGSGSNSRSQGSGSNSGSEASFPPVHGAPPPAIEPLEPTPPREPILRVLERQEHIIPRSEEERNRIAGLAEREFQHSRVFDPQLLHAIGLLDDFENAL
ncbi:hypothetical protein EJB05_34449, partial [Eragrostis curvula]